MSVAQSFHCNHFVENKNSTSGLQLIGSLKFILKYMFPILYYCTAIHVCKLATNIRSIGWIVRHDLSIMKALTYTYAYIFINSDFAKVISQYYSRWYVGMIPVHTMREAFSDFTTLQQVAFVTFISFFISINITLRPFVSSRPEKFIQFCLLGFF